MEETLLKNRRTGDRVPFAIQVMIVHGDLA